MSKRIALTVSGVIASDVREQITNGLRPRADYLELARSFDADILDYTVARRIAGRIGTLLERIGGPNLTLAFCCWKVRKNYRAIFTDGEQVGLPLAALLKLTPGPRPRHLMIVHVLSEPKKTVFLDWFGVQSAIDRFLTYSSWQQRFIRDRWKLSSDRVLWTPFMVDQEFFSPDKITPNSSVPPQICAVGLERRDYDTLLRAVQNIDVHIVIAAASPWAKSQGGIAEETTSASNVTVRKFSQYELRQLYADSRFMVMPLQPVKFQAGVTAILECMAMRRAVICTRTPGQTDVVIEGENGRYVPPGDSSTLGEEIRRLLSHPEEAISLGVNGRKLVEHQMNLDLYVQNLTDVLHQVVEESL